MEVPPLQKDESGDEDGALPAAKIEEEEEEEEEEEAEGVGASCPRHIAIAAFHPGHDFYRGGALLERNIAVWIMAGKLLMRFDERAREDMEMGGDEGLSQALAEEIVSAATNLKVAAAEEAESCATEVADILLSLGHDRGVENVVDLT